MRDWQVEQKRLNRIAEVILILWIRLKRLLVLAVVLSVSMTLVSCSSKSDTAILNYISEVSLSEFHQEELYEYETPYTLCFNNSDGTTSVYIFSSPIAFYDEEDKLKLIDNSIIDVTDKNMRKNGYVYQNKSSDITTYYPSNLESSPIMIKDGGASLSVNPTDFTLLNDGRLTKYVDRTDRTHDAVSYVADSSKTQIQYISTASGINANITFNENPNNPTLSFYLKYSGEAICNQDSNQYTAFNDSLGNPLFVIGNSFLKDSYGNTSFLNTVSVNEDNAGFKYTILLDEEFLNTATYPISFNPSFEIIRDVIMNNAVYSGMPDVSNYLSKYNVIGNSEPFGIGIGLSKLRINYFLRSYADNIKSATYNTVSLASTPGLLKASINRIDDDWVPRTVTWESAPKAGKEESVLEISDDTKVSFDISYQIKRCVNDDSWFTEVTGMSIQSKNPSDSCYKILANANNSLYQTYIRIDFYDSPWSFEKVKTVN